MSSFHHIQALGRSDSSVDGFSLIEVLVSILMIASFLAIAMQTLIAATAIKVKSEEISEATAWIQEDLEALRFEANRLDFAGGLYSPDMTSCDTTGYAARLQNQVETGGFDYSGARQVKQNSLGGRQYVLLRTFTPQDDVLEVSHSLFRDNDNDGIEDGTAIGTLYSEIVPDAAFACPG